MTELEEKIKNRITEDNREGRHHSDTKNNRDRYFLFGNIELPISKYNFWKLKNKNEPVEIGNIEADEEKNLQETVKRKKTQIKSFKKQNQNEDIEFQGHIFKGGLIQIDKYEKSRDLALALGLDKGNFFDKNDFPVGADLDEANTLLKALGIKIYKCKVQESDVAVQIQAILDNPDFSVSDKIEQVENIEWIHIGMEY